MRSILCAILITACVLTKAQEVLYEINRNNKINNDCYDLCMYYGVENTIIIVKEGRICEEMDWYYRGSKLMREDCKYFITPADSDFFYITSSRGDSLLFHGVTLPLPRIVAFPYTNHDLLLYHLYNLECNWSGLVKFPYKIKSFEIEFCHNGTSLYYEQCIGDSVSATANAFLRNHQEINDVVFQNVVIEYSDFYSQTVTSTMSGQYRNRSRGPSKK